MKLLQPYASHLLTDRPISPFCASQGYTIWVIYISVGMQPMALGRRIATQIAESFSLHIVL